MRLTENQATVYRTIREEELDAGNTEDEANRAAHRFMVEEALPNWRQFWTDWNRPPGPIETMLQATAALAMFSAIARHPKIVAALGQQMSEAFRFVTGETPQA